MPPVHVSGRKEAEAGYALLTAVLAMAMLAALSVTLIQANRSSNALAAAEIERAKLDAAAEAGLVLVVRQLSLTESYRRWAPDGTTHHLTFDGMAITARIEDERGKVPLNLIDEKQAQAMFAALGVEQPQRDALADALLDWRDRDDTPRPHGAERAYYAPLGREPRNGPFRSLDELLEVRGMTPALLARLRPVASVIGGEGVGFDERYAQPLAIRIMGGSEVTALVRQRELAGERPALALNEADTLTSRPITVRIAVADGAAGALRRSWLIQLTGQSAPSYLVRAVD